MLGTSLNPLASNHGALAQSNPSPKVLSGAVIYQWHEASGTSTEHFDQSSYHCGTWTHNTEDSNNDSKLIIVYISYNINQFYRIITYLIWELSIDSLKVLIKTFKTINLSILC